MVSAQDSGSSGPGSNPGQGRCFVFLSISEIMLGPGGDNPVMD